MTKDELIERLKGYEWRDIEFKAAQRDVPKDAYKTVSAFSNTEGGRLVFGVKDNRGNYTVVGVLEVDKVQNDFITTLRSGSKLSCDIKTYGSIVDHEDGTLLAFYIPEARRQEKPVHLDGNIRESYVRRGGCDQRCNQEELRRFIHDASDKTYDSEPVEEYDIEDCLDKDAVKWYRMFFSQRNPGDIETISDVEFLDQLGLAVESADKLTPTRAAIILFGDSRAISKILPRPVVDYQWIESSSDDWSTDKRWEDRLTIENNLIQAWRMLLSQYMKHAEKPFSLDKATLRRTDDPPDYISFREAAINLLIHQDFGDHTRIPFIKFFRDCTIFWNPGDAFATTDELLDSKPIYMRNPRIVTTFRRIGLSDQAGTGIRSIFDSWGRLGHIPPDIENDKEQKTFQLILHKEELISEEQLLFQASLGVHLSDDEAKTFAYACRKRMLSLTDIKAVTGLSRDRSRKILAHLVVQVLLEPVGDTGNELYQLAEHLRDRFVGEVRTEQVSEDTARLVSDQPLQVDRSLVTDQAPLIESVSEIQWKIIQLCDVPRPMLDIMDEIGLTHRSFFRRRHLNPLIEGNVIRYTHPEQPNHPDQKYVLTEIGIQLKLKHLENLRNDKEEGK